MAFTPRVLTRAVLLRLLLFFALSVIFTGTAWLWYQSPQQETPVFRPHYKPSETASHPIDYLMKKADSRNAKLLSLESKDVNSAARAYRKRRGRHPPPGFAEWFQFAQDNDAVIVEHFFDQIYHDLGPFWGVEAKEIRLLAKNNPNSISIREGNASINTDVPDNPRSALWQWINIWFNMTTGVATFLPNIDVPLNLMDESRVVVPWETINKYMQAERATRKLVHPSKVLTEFTKPEDLDDLENPKQPPIIDWQHKGPYWNMARVGCPPNSPGRHADAVDDLSGPPPMPTGFPIGSFDGYVQNWTYVKNPCLHPDLREAHGSFIEPISKSTTHSLIPLFGGSKLSMNNEILIPPAMYWTDDPSFSTGDDAGIEWEKKSTKVMWRGHASGGRNRVENWTRFHRHRFVSMVNGTTVELAREEPSGAGKGPNFVLQSYKTYHLILPRFEGLGTWLRRVVDVGVTHLSCFPGTGSPRCPYTDPYYEVQPRIPMKDQFANKYLPDLDGNSFSGRYRTFLKSTSVPIKATVYSEWHDSRLIPWLHFIPMDNTYVDIYGILDYFLGTGVEFKANDGRVIVEGAHDEAAKKIAMEGKAWADKVLRKEDMVIYVMRVLLEYGRLCDDHRERLGFIDDLKE